jgi:DNA-binding transcriptional LysR family regulator
MFDSHERGTPAYQKMNAAEYSMDDLLWFLRVARAGSLSGAATQLGVPKSTLSRRLERMETAMGVALVHRNSRSFRLSEVGERLVRFSASGSFGRLVLVPLISSYLLEHPDVRIDTELTDRKVNIIKEGFDFAVRIGELPDSGLRMRRIARVSRVLCAAPAYVAKHGLPKTPEELARHHCLVQSKAAASFSLQGASRTVDVVLRARLIAGPSDILAAPVSMGLGISPLPEIQVAGELRRGELVRVLPGWDMAEFDVQILYPAQSRLPPATRSLMEYFAAKIPPTIVKLLAAR